MQKTNTDSASPWQPFLHRYIQQMPKRLGRPTKAPKPGTRVPLSFRVTADIRRKLEDAAIKNGRSLSHEAEFRLERTFIGQNLEVLDRLDEWGAHFQDLLRRFDEKESELEAREREIEKRKK